MGGMIRRVRTVAATCRRRRRATQPVAPRSLKAAGADDATLRRIMVDSSRWFLAFVPERPRKG
jgi:hypothetical protein